VTAAALLFRRGALAAALVMALGLQAPVHAQEPGDEPANSASKRPDPDNGLTVARKLCVGCHLIGDGLPAAAPTEAPAFASVANRPNQSAEALTNWLIAPHPPMPDPHLATKEIRDLGAYILSLRKSE
jgi:mono/diheme cytochrome c family protein